MLSCFHLNPAAGGAAGFLAMIQGGAMPIFAIILGRTSDIMQEGEDQSFSESMKPMLEGLAPIAAIRRMSSNICGQFHCR